MRERFTLMGSNLHTISLKPLPLIGTGFKSEIDNSGDGQKKESFPRRTLIETILSSPNTATGLLAISWKF